MKVFELEREVLLPVDVQTAFAFFREPTNLGAITPPWVNLEVFRSSDDEIGQGTRIDYRLRLHGIPMRWTSVIPVWDPPHRFVDEQVRGPYRLWVHTHSFEERPVGTLARDHVRYSPLGGRFTNPLVRPRIEAIFDYRSKRLLELLPGASFGASSGR